MSCAQAVWVHKRLLLQITVLIYYHCMINMIWIHSKNPRKQNFFILVCTIYVFHVAGDKHKNYNNFDYQSVPKKIMDNEFVDISTSLRLQLGYGIGHVLNDVCASLWFTYFLVFFHLVLEFSASQAGKLMLIGQIVDALSTPFVGYCSDRTDNIVSLRYGRRKLWHLFGGWIFVILLLAEILCIMINLKNIFND